MQDKIAGSRSILLALFDACCYLPCLGQIWQQELKRAWSTRDISPCKRRIVLPLQAWMSFSPVEVTLVRWIHARQENKFKIVFQVCRMHCDCRSFKFFLRRMETIILGRNIQKLHHACNPFANLLPVRTAQRLVQNVTSFLELNNRLLADFAMLFRWRYLHDLCPF